MERLEVLWEGVLDAEVGEGFLSCERFAMAAAAIGSVFFAEVLRGDAKEVDGSEVAEERSGC